ncbi:LamG-like jellyroll fold domain-containing protein [Acanthopleuribacter pedis]|uniref:Carboxypeptidase regulatory-like domain-containing protein n=1 Tax=Acanthopleuribacter pedis TaxID=442870 RepID=A0A8J7QER8_9BACT|nr:LamG-like jellyroll fold domain-containing protein [Acanthopleuribacter pedis]MBO1318410.1 carboxypeptidase regulatory-like domain-containing protein [Acanthopleuribacter pedis]
MFRFLGLFLACLPAVAFQIPTSVGSTTDLPSAVFRIEQQGFRISPERRILLMEEPEGSVVFDYFYDAPNQSGWRLQGLLISPSGGEQTLSQDFSLGRLVLTRDQITEEGTWQITNLQILDGDTLVAESSPAVVSIDAVAELLVARATVEEMTPEELAELGHVFNPNDYRSIKFNLALVMGSTEVPVNIPVLLPRDPASRLKALMPISDPFLEGIVVAGEPRFGGVPSLFFVGEETVSPIKAEGYVMSLVVIPGKIHHLKTMFRAAVLVVNAAPDGLEVRVNNLQAKIEFPTPTKYGHPLGLSDTQNGGLERPMVNLGADGESGTSDDRDFIDPAEEAVAEYILRGNVPGMYDVRFDISGQANLGDDDPFRVTSTAEARVYVRSPDFTVTFEHPDTVATGEPYDLTMHINNVGEVPLNDFNIEIDPFRLVGVTMEAGTDPRQAAGTIAPGGEASLTWRLRADTTGQVVASYYRVEDGISSDLQLSIGIAPSGERLTNRVLIFPPEFEAGFEDPLKANVKRFAKKVYDLSHMVEEEVPTHLLPIAGRDAGRLNKRFGFSAVSLGLGANSDQAHLSLLRNVIGAMDGHEAIDRFRREMTRISEPNMTAAFEPLLQNWVASRGHRDLLTWMAEESRTIDNLALVLVEGDPGLSLAVTDPEGRVSSDSGALDIPFSAVFNLGPGRRLAWLGGLSGAPQITVSGAVGGPLRVQAVFNPNPATAMTFLDTGSWTPTVDPTLTLQPVGGRWDIEENRVVRQVQGEIVPSRAFGVVGVKHMSPLDGQDVDINGRHVAFQFSRPLDLSAIAQLGDHIQIEGAPVVLGKLQNNPHFLVVKSRHTHGPYRPINYRLEGLTALDGTVMAPQTGSFDGDPFFSGVSVTGRIVDQSGTDIQAAKVYLEVRGGWSDVIEGDFIIEDVKTPDANGGYRFDFVPFIKDGVQVPSEDTNPYEYDRHFYERLARHLDRKKDFRITVELADGRRESRKFTPQAPGQNIVAEFSFLDKGTIFGRLVDPDGLPIANAPIYASNQERLNGYAQLTTTDGDGNYRFDGLEVGQVVVKTAKPGGELAWRSVFLTKQNSPYRLDISFDSIFGRVEGQVVRVIDGELIPQPNMLVGWHASSTRPFYYYRTPDDLYPLPYNGLAYTDSNGFFRLEEMPGGIGSLWAWGVGGYATRKLTMAGNEFIRADLQIVYQERHTVNLSGRVVDGQDFPLADMDVQVGNHYTKSASDGSFSFENVPISLGNHRVNAYKNRDVWPWDALLRGHATVNMAPEMDDITELLIVAIPDPVITGRYLDVAGNPIPFAPVYNPPNDGLKPPVFAYTDHEGIFKGSLFDTSNFPGMWWDPHVGLQVGGNHFTGLRYPKLAHTEVTVGVEGYENLVVQEEPQSQIRVRLVDGQGAPVIGTVEVRGYLPSSDEETMGMPVFGTLYRRVTDNDGGILFDQLNTRETTIQGTHPLLGETEVYSYVPAPLAEGAEVPSITLAFNSQAEPTNLFGRVFDSDGVSPAPEGTLVVAEVGGVTAKTRTNPEGWYWFESLVNTGSRQLVDLVVYHPNSTHWAGEKIMLNQEMRFRNDLILAQRGTVNVHLVDHDGVPVESGNVVVSYQDISYQDPQVVGELGELDWVKQEFSAQVLANTNPVQFTNLPVGEVQLRAAHGNGLSALKSVLLPRDGRTLDIYLHLETPGSISGVFFDHANEVIPNGEVQLTRFSQLLAQRVTDDASTGNPGFFNFEALPMRRYRLHGTDPDSGLTGTTEVEPTPFRPDAQVDLRLDPVGHINGVVQYQGQTVPNARIRLMSGWEGRPELNLVTGADEYGLFELRNLPLDRYRLIVSSNVTAEKALEFIEISESGETITPVVRFSPMHELLLNVLHADGTPAAHVSVSVNGGGEGVFDGATGYTDENGQLLLYNLRPNTYTVWGKEPRYRDDLYTPITISPDDPQRVEHSVQFPGWGVVRGQVLDERGVPIDFPVRVRIQDPIRFGSDVWTYLNTDAGGSFTWWRARLGQRMSAVALSSRNYESDTQSFYLENHGDEVDLVLTLRQMTTASGQVVFEDGTPVPYAKVWVDEPIQIITQADEQGRYSLEPIRVGGMTVFAKDPFSPRTGQAFRISDSTGEGAVLPHTDVTIQLGGVGTLSGNVFLSDGSPVTYGHLMLEHQQSGAMRQAALFADGGWLQTNIPMGTYTARAYDAERTMWSEDSFELDLVEDGGSAAGDLTFQPSFEIRGRIFAEGGTNGVRDAMIELWRRQNGVRWQRVYRDVSRDDGFYSLEHVYPGTYRVVIGDETLSNTLKTELVVGDADMLEMDWVLRPARSISGVVTNADTIPLYPGAVRVFSLAGQLLDSVSLNQRGEFQLEDFDLDEVRLQITTLKGWYTFDQVVQLQPGANAFNFTGPATVRVRGRLIAQAEQRVGVAASLSYRGSSRGVMGGNDGAFEISHVPVGEVLTLTVTGQGTRRMTVGPFSTDTDLGDIYIDTTPPELADFPDGIRVTQMPATLRIPVTEAEQDSNYLPEKTKVWLNGQSMDVFLVADADAVVLQVPAFPEGAVRGYNVLKVQVENDADRRAVKNYELYIESPGATVAVKVNDYRWRDAVGQVVQLEDGRTFTTDDRGFVYVYNVTGAAPRFWARSGDDGAFLGDVALSQTAATTFGAMRLVPAGGYLGQVTDVDGNPLADVTVWAENQPARTDGDGRYFMRVVPINQETDLIVDEPRGFGLRQAGRIAVPGTFADGYDIQVEPVGTLVGTVYDSNGTTPISGASVSLAYDSVSERFHQTATTDSDGAYRIERVFAEPLRLTARHPSTNQVGLVVYPSMQPGQTATLDIHLEPVGTLVGRLLLPDGNPAAAVTLNVVDQRDIVYASAVSAADGAFQIDEVPYGTFALSADARAGLAYLDQAITLSQNSLTLGDLSMAVDLPPTLTVELPPVYDPVLRPQMRLVLEDDRALASMTVVADDYPERAVTRNIGGVRSTTSFNPPLPDSIPYGPLPLTITVRDHFDQEVVWTGALNVADDITPPGLTLVSPTETLTLEEGRTFEVVADTVDAYSVTVTYDGFLLGTGYRGPFGSDRFTAEVRVPPVDASGVVEVNLIARDRRGNETRLGIPVNVLNRDISGAPDLEVMSHVDGQVMPLNLDRDLNLDLRLRMNDPDGLAVVTVRFEGEEVLRAGLTETNHEVTHRLVLPPSASRREQVRIVVDVDDLGFNRTSQTITLNNIDGEVFDADNPLNIGRYTTAFDNRSLILVGGAHVIDGAHAPQDLVLVNGAEVTLSKSSGELLGDAAVTDLDVGLHLVIAAGSAIRADKAGFPDFSLYPGATVYPSHGGLSVDDDSLRKTHGSMVEPLLVAAYSGGGAIRLQAPNLWLQGEVTARGGWAKFPYLGAGGSIWLQSPNLQGRGLVSADAYATRSDEIAGMPGGGGGRIAVYGAGENLSLQALGRAGGGHGTIFLSLPDPAYADGTRDILRVAGLATTEVAAATPIPYFTGIVGQDIQFLPTQQGPDGYRDHLILPEPAGYHRYRGLYVWREGEPENRKRIDFNSGTEIVSEANEAFPVFADGDRLHIGYPLDAVEVVDGGRFRSEAGLVRAPVFFDGGFLHAGDGVTHLLRDDAVIRRGGGLEGAFEGPAMTLPTGLAFSVDGSLAVPQMELPDGATLHLNGTLMTDRLVVAAGATVDAVPWASAPMLDIQATEAVIDGTLQVAPKKVDGGTDGYWTHAGLRGNSEPRSPHTSGSLYEPGSFAGGLGGVVRLRFDELVLNGTLDVGVGEVGGAAWLQGLRLTGSGSISADGKVDYRYVRGGGRIALWVDDQSGFSGSLSARGYDQVSFYGSAGAGTTFIKTPTWPDGRLIVDNGGQTAGVDSTVLPIFGIRVAGAGTTPTVLTGAFPAHREFVGMFLVLEGQEPQRITEQSATALTLAGPINGLAEGVSVTAFHRFSGLVARGGAALYTTDPIQVTGDVVLDGGQINAPVTRIGATDTRVFADGSGELTQDDGTRIYELDNFHLTVQFPLDVARISLRNGASLTYYQPVRVETLEVDGGSLYSGVSDRAFGLTATTVSLTNGSLWSAAANRDGFAPARINVDVAETFTLDATSRVETNGENGGASSSPGGSNDYSHAGYHALRDSDTGTASTNPIHGSLFRPEAQIYRGGGAIHIRCADFQLDGTVSAAGVSQYAGGSIWLEANNFLGSGTLTTGNNPGRMALYHGGDAGFLNRYTILSSTPENVHQTYGGGTLFVKGADQTHGELIVDQDALNRHSASALYQRYRMTGVVGPARLTVSAGDSDPDPLVIDDLTWSDLPSGLGGLWVKFTVDGVDYAARIRDNDARKLMLEAPAEGNLPASLPAGTELRFELRLDRLHLRNGAQLYFAGDLTIGELLLDQSDKINSIWARSLNGLPNPMSLNNNRLRLVLDAPNLAEQAFQLQDSQLWFDKPITLDSLNLVNSQVLHSPPERSVAVSQYTPWLHLTARSVTMDATSWFGGTRIGDSRGEDNSAAWYHGGTLGNFAGPYGSLFAPDRLGVGLNYTGARIYLKADTLTGGTFDVTSANGAAGSIQLDLGTVSGDITLNAGKHPTSHNPNGGGRIAVVYDTLVNANFIADTRADGSSGTFFLKDRAADYGRLIIDNGDLGVAGERETVLPSFAPVTLDANFTLSNDGVRSTLFVPGMNLADDFRGYQLAANGDMAALFPIEATENRDGGTAFTLTGVLSGLQVGDLIEPVVRVSEVRLCADCRLGPASLKIVTDSQFPVGHVFADGEGSFIEPPAMVDGHLILDGYSMQIERPVNYAALTLRNGASLRLNGAANQINNVQLDGGTFIIAEDDQETPTLSADAVTLANNAVLSVLYLAATDLTVDAGSTLQGVVYAGEPLRWGTGSVSLTTAAPVNYGGEARTSWRAVRFGDFRRPWRVTTGMSRLRIEAVNASVDGTLFPGLNPDLGQVAPGGALWLTADQLQGNGRIHANAPVYTRTSDSAAGGGCVAVYTRDRSAWQGMVEARGAVYSGSSVLDVDRDHTGSGTVFMKSETQTHGELHLLGNGRLTLAGMTRVPSLGQITLGDAAVIDGNRIDDPDADYPIDLRGLHLVVDEDGTPQTFEITDNTKTSITVAGSLPALNAGTVLRAQLHLDRIHVTDNARFYTPDHLVIHDQIVPSSRADAGEIWSRRLSLPQPAWTLDGGSTGLRVDETTNLTDLVVRNGTLQINGSLSIARVTLGDGGVLTHGQTLPPNKERLPHPFYGMRLQVQTLTIASGGHLNLDNKGLEGRPGIASNGYGHAGDYPQGYAYGSVFEPDLPGGNLGGGVLKLNADVVQLDGALTARGPAGGSLWLDVGVIRGNGLVSADAVVADYGSAGRVALYYDDNQLVRLPSAKSPKRADSNVLPGAGTVYLKKRGARDGELYVLNDAYADVTLYRTPLAAVGNHSLTETPSDPRIIRMSGVYWRPAFAGMEIIDLQTDQVYRVVSHDFYSLTLDRPITPAPTAGWSFRGRAPISRVLQANATLEADATELIVPILDGYEVNPPTIDSLVFDVPYHDAVLSGAAFAVDLAASDVSGVTGATLSFNGGTETGTGAGPWRFAFTAPVVATAATYTLDVTVTDAFDNVQRLSRNLQVLPADTVAPTLTVSQPLENDAVDAEQSFIARVEVADNYGLDRIAYQFNDETRPVSLAGAPTDHVDEQHFTTPVVVGDQSMALTVSVYDGAGLSTAVTTNILVRDKTAPEPATALTALPTSTEAELRWTASGDSAGDLAGYEISLDGGTPIQVDGTTLTYTFTGLSAETAYQVTVTSVDGSGNRAEPASATFTTLSESGTSLIAKPDAWWSFNRDSADQGVLSFNRAGHVNFPDSVDIARGAEGMTFAFWAKGNTFSGSQAVLTLRHPDNSYEELVQLFFSSTQFYCYVDYGPSSRRATASTGGFQPDVWYRMVATIDTTQRRIALYRDGQFIRHGTLQGTGPLPDFSMGYLQLGGEGDRNFFDGDLRDVQVWRGVWNADDVTADYRYPGKATDLRVASQYGFSMNPNDLVAAWPLDGRETGSVVDTSYHQNNGILVGTAWGTSSQHLFAVPDHIGGLPGAYGPQTITANGVFGNALVFDGTQSAREWSAPAFSGSSFASSLMVRLDSLPSQVGRTMTLFEAGAAHLYVDSQDQLVWEPGDGATLTAAGALTAGQWHHLVVRRDGETTHQLRVDGVAVAEAPLLAVTQPGGAWSLARRVGGNDPLIGAVDEWMLWSTQPEPTALDKLGREPLSALSAGLSLAMVADLAWSGSTDRIDLSWSTRPNQPGPAAWLVSVDGGAPVRLGPTARSYQITGLSAGATHQVTVQAETEGGDLSRGATRQVATAAASAAAGMGPAARFYVPFDQDGPTLTGATFAGNDDQITLASGENLFEGAPGMTYAAWVKIPNTTTAYQLFYLGDGNNTQEPLQVYTSSGRLTLATRPGPGLSSVSANTSHFLNDATWHRVAMVVDFANNNLRLYVDGELSYTRTSISNNPGVFPAGHYPVMVLGAKPKSSSRGFHGAMADVQVWRAPWREEDVAFDWANPLRDAEQTADGSVLSPRRDLLLRVLYGQNSGNTVYDRSGNGQHGSAANVNWSETLPLHRFPERFSGRALAVANLTSVAGYSGQAVDFAATGAKARLDAEGLQGHNGVTASLWFQAPPLGVDGTLIAQSDHHGGVEVGFDRALRPFLATRADTRQTAAAAMTPGQWHHLAVTLEPNVGTRLFLDGNPAGFIAGNPSLTAEPWRFGHLVRGGGALNGVVDEFALWEQVLPAQRLQQMVVSGQAHTALFEVPVNEAEVTNLTAAPEANRITFIWQAPSQSLATVTGYRVYRDGAASGVFIAAPQTTHLWDGLSPDQRVTLRVTAVDEWGNESPGRILEAWTMSDPSAATAPGAPSSWYDYEFPALSRQLASFADRGRHVGVSANIDGFLAGARGATLAAWFRLDPKTSYSRQELIKVSRGFNTLLALQVNGGRVQFLARPTSSIGNQQVQSNLGFDDGRWHRAVGVVDVADKVVRLYVDGVLVHERTVSWSMASWPDPSEVDAVELGDDSYYYPNGLIWNAQVWRAPFDAEAVAHDLRFTFQTAAEHDAVSSVTAADLAAHWWLNEGVNGTVADSSGRERHGIATDLVWVDETHPINVVADQAGTRHLDLFDGVPIDQGISGQALSVSGFGVGLRAADAADLDAGFAVSLWFKPERLPSQEQAEQILVHQANGDWALGLTIEDRLIFDLAGRVNATAAPPLSSGSWYHLVVTGTPGGSVAVYLNGVRVADEALSANGGLTPGLQIGGGANGLRPIFAALDQTGIWANTLTANQVSQLWQHPAGGPLAKRSGTAAIRQSAPASDGAGAVEPSRGGPVLADVDPIVETVRGEKWVREVYQTENALVLDNTELELNGSLIARSIELRNGARLTHAPLADGQPGVLLIAAAERIEIDRRSLIDLNGRGWRQSEATFNPAHGTPALSGQPGTVYGSIVQPNLPGGGKSGGGAVVLIAPEIVIDGRILARGLGFSSGGSVFIQCADLSGAGLVDVRGGEDADGRGGAGRIAVHSDRTFRFGGRMETGSPERALIFSADSRGENRRLSATFPADEKGRGRTKVVLPPALRLSADAFKNVRLEGRRLVAEVSSEQDLQQYLGFTARGNLGRLQLTEVMRLTGDSWVLWFDGDRLGTRVGDLTFAFEVGNAEQLAADKGMVPVVPR